MEYRRCVNTNPYELLQIATIEIYRLPRSYYVEIIRQTPSILNKYHMSCIGIAYLPIKRAYHASNSHSSNTRGTQTQGQRETPTSTAK
jgi:hypothetical protein